MSPPDKSPDKIGPGRLVVVVGPSGAGKDTLIALARARCSDDPKIVFPRRIVTRTPTADEDHDSVSDADFDACAQAGGFAAWWQAHGLKYGIPAEINDAVRSGKTIVCNVSRTAIAQLRERYANCRVVLVTAPADVLLTRLAQRHRASDGDPAQRLRRDVPAECELRADVVIENVGMPGQGAAALLDILRRL